jgi:hypothetical protein
MCIKSVLFLVLAISLMSCAKGPATIKDTNDGENGKSKMLMQ